jgi:hypothetical protein
MSAKEGSDFDVTTTFYDLTGKQEVPTSIKWQVYDKDSGTAMNTEQTIAVPAATVTITIPIACNAMVDEDKTSEVRRLEVRGGYAGSRGYNASYEYGLYNLFGS